MDKKTLKKQEIIRKSIDVMYKQGYHGTGVKDLTDAAGIPKGSLYNYFENKEDYLKEALNYYHEVMSKELFDKLSDTKLKPTERIRQFYSIMIEHVLEKNEFCKGCFVGKLAQEMSGSSDGIQEVINQINLDIINKIKVNLEEAITIGEMSNNVNAEMLAEFIWNSWQGSVQGLKVSRDKRTLDIFYEVLTHVLLK